MQTYILTLLLLEGSLSLFMVEESRIAFYWCTLCLTFWGPEKEGRGGQRTDVAGIIYFKTDQLGLQSSASFCWNHTSPQYECLRLSVTKTSADKLTVGCQKQYKVKAPVDFNTPNHDVNVCWPQPDSVPASLQQGAYIKYR